MHFLSYILFSLMIYSSLIQINSYKKNTAERMEELPVINKIKSYPRKTNDLKTEVTYIPLETSKDIILDQDAHIYYLSNNRMLITNWRLGDVFIFDMNGKIVSHFNQKGGMGYTYISFAVYDEKNKEIYILDKFAKKIIVFTEEGILKRTLHIPQNINLNEIYMFDESSLLAHHEYINGPLQQKQPFILICKKDGSIEYKLNISLKSANSRYQFDGNRCFITSNNYSGNCKFGSKFVISSISSDTIYLLKKDKTLVPLFVQYPSVLSDPKIITSVGMITDDYIIFSIYPLDLNEVKRAYEKGDNVASDGGVKYIMYEFKTKKFFECKNQNKRKLWAEKIDVPENIGVELINAYQLANHFKQGLLQGKLKEVASKLNAYDNPVVKISKFK